jgi:hypothetical protein
MTKGLAHLLFKALYKAVLASFIWIVLTACEQPSVPLLSTPTPTPIATFASANTLAALQVPKQAPFYVIASVWQADPVVPIILYHRFKTNNPSTANMVSRLDFKNELETLYESGYVTISLQKWLAGDLRVPEGKRPIVLSMDDLFYRNQIVLTSEGTPSDQTGLGLAWKFSQEHPNFGFHWALFANLGDKPFGDGKTLAERDIQLANVIVWCLENDAMVYNHTYRHVRFKYTNGIGVTAELKSNDLSLRRLLTLVNRQDLISKPGNLFALPAGQWPRTKDAQTALYGYKNPEGIPLQAIFDVDFIGRPNFMAAPYAKKFDRYKLPRMVATLDAIKYLKENKETIPVAHQCEVGPLDQARTGDVNYMGEQVLNMVQSGKCSEGVYAMEHFVFRVNTTQVELLHDITRNK